MLILREKSACILFVILVLAQGTLTAREVPKSSSPSAAGTDFERDVAPLLRDKCHSCHGPNQQMGGLRLDNKADALKGGNSGVVIKPGDSANSRLIRL